MTHQWEPITLTVAGVEHEIGKILGGTDWELIREMTVDWLNEAVATQEEGR